MRHILISLMISSLALFAGACGNTGDQIDTTADRGDQPMGERSSRIIGGSSYDGLPAVGSLLYNGNQHCTGTLIGPRKVLTAAHCVDGFSASRMKFAIGPNAYSPQATVQAVTLEPHPGYNPQSISNDIGLVYLAENAPVAPMAVVGAMDSGWVGTELFFVGYGVSDGYNQSGAGLKRAVWMSISQVNPTSFRYDDPNRNTCNGDSGGPAFYRSADGSYRVAGVTSYGDAYCTQYGVDTRVDAYLDFLQVDPGDEPNPPDEPVDPCEGETWEGRCDGDTVVWCENEQVNRQDCSADGKVCGFSEENQYYACLEQPEEPEEPADPCAGETFVGRCDGDTVVWCENEQVNRQDCSADGKVCGFSEEKQYYACLEQPPEPEEPEEPADPCNGESYEGRCDGGSVIWCEDEQVNSIDCTQYGKTCSWDGSKGFYNCL